MLEIDWQGQHMLLNCKGKAEVSHRLNKQFNSYRWISNSCSCDHVCLSAG